VCTRVSAAAEGKMGKRSQDSRTSALIVLVIIFLVIVFLVVPFIFVVEAVLVIFFLFVIDRRKIEFHWIDGDHLKFNAALGARDYFSNVLEFIIDNGFAFRTIAHSLPPIKAFREIETINY
jgi:hypothetical protein